MTLPIRAFIAIILFLASSTIAIGAAFAQNPVETAQKLPVEISEVVSGGIWANDGMEGVYRAAVILQPEGEMVIANVVVQLVAFQEAGKSPKLVKTIAINEIAEKKLSNAFLSMNSESEKGMTLIVTSYDPEKEEQSALFVQFDDMGNYSIVKPGTAGAESLPPSFPSDEAGKK